MEKIACTERYLSFGDSRQGGRSENQDYFKGALLDDGLILTVCDGMGGAQGGRTASHLAVDEIIRTMKESYKSLNPSELLELALTNANRAIFNMAKNDPHLHGMGSTATILYLNDDASYVAHVGDSRVYQLRQGGKQFCTFDHSKVFELVAIGAITREQARTSANSNIITRALGVRYEVKPDIEIRPYKKGDRFVLCCDGIWNTMPEPELLALFSAKGNLEDVTANLVNTVDAIGRDSNEEYDNLTAIVVDVLASSRKKESSFKVLIKMRKKFTSLFKHQRNNSNM